MCHHQYFFALVIWYILMFAWFERYAIGVLEYEIFKYWLTFESNKNVHIKKGYFKIRITLVKHKILIAFILSVSIVRLRLDDTIMQDLCTLRQFYGAELKLLTDHKFLDFNIGKFVVFSSCCNCLVWYTLHYCDFSIKNKATLR